MKVVLLASLLGVEATGQSAVVSTLSARLVSAGQQVTVLATDCSAGGGLQQPSEYVHIPPEVDLKIFPSKGRFNRRVFRSPELTTWLRSHINEFDILDVQGVWSVAGRDAARVFSAANKPYVLTPHGMMTKYDWQKSMLRRKAFFRFGFGPVWREADAIRFLSLGERANSYHPAIQRAEIIPNCIDVPSIPTRQDARDMLSIPSKAQVLLFLGRFTHQKGVKEMLEAFEIAASENEDLLFYLVGPHEEGYGDEVVAQVSKSRFRDRIHITGPVYGSDKYVYLAAADAFITLSFNEGQSVAHLEAMATGLPMILTESSNMDHLLEYGAGLVTTHNPIQVAATIFAVISDEAHRAKMSLQAKKLVDERYTPAIVMPQLIQLYRDLLR